VTTSRQVAADKQRIFVKRPQFLVVVATALILAGTLVVVSQAYVGANTPGNGSPYLFASVQRGDLEVSTIATGRIDAIDAVEVSSQLSGQVVKLYATFNDKVAANAPLAQLDDKLWQAAVAQAEALLTHAEASHESALAALAGANARYDEAFQGHQRKQTLAEQGNISTQEIDQARAKLLTAKSELDAARANTAVEKATIDIAAAALRTAEINLERTVIRSPIAGIIIGRNVELGQTVAVSLQAPTLFIIAHDLSEMRVYAHVDEADIGQIQMGQKVRFSVDAYPDRAFAGRVVEIHSAPETVQNVVTYSVVITASNPDLALLPGMTAVVRISTTERSGALLVPNAALRFEPETTPPKASNRDEPGIASAGRPAHVWLRGKSADLQQAAMGIGASDGSMTEVVSGPLSEGQEVAIRKQPIPDGRTLFGLRLGF
jgi:HlyD family secretion protein